MANRCELMCPAKEMLNYEYEQARGVKKRLLAVSIGIQGARLLVRANAECPARNLSGTEWEPSDVCSERAQELAAKLGPITVEATTEHQQTSFLMADIEIVGLSENTPTDTEEPPKA